MVSFKQRYLEAALRSRAHAAVALQPVFQLVKNLAYSGRFGLHIEEDSIEELSCVPLATLGFCTFTCRSK